MRMYMYMYMLRYVPLPWYVWFVCSAMRISSLRMRITSEGTARRV